MTAILRFAAIALWLVAGSATAQPDISQSFPIADSTGFPNVCAAPCFIVEKSVDVFFDGNLDAPGVCAAGENTYVYTLTHLGGTLPFPGVNITEFELLADSSLISTFGNVGPGIAPTAVVPGTNIISWEFPDATACPNCLDEGQSSAQLYLCSAAPPGVVPDVISTTAIILDEQSECIVPVQPACSLEIDKTCCLPAPPAAGVDVCEGKVLSATFEVVGGACSATTNDQEGKAKCTGPDPLPGGVGSVDIDIIKDDDKIAANGTIGGTTGVPVGGTVTFTNEVDSNGELKASTKFEVTGVGGTQEATIHTSCSKALSCNDQFGSLKLVSITTTEGGTTVCPDPDAEGTQCVQDPGAPFACEDKIASILFEWTGDACSGLANNQGGKAKCSGSVAGAEPVNVTYVGGDQDKITVDPSSDIDVGEQFSITATGRDDLKASTKFVVSDAGGVVQNVEIHTSCSKALDCGDEFGGFKIVQILGTDGTTCDLTPPGPLFQQACEVPLAPPTPHCTDKLMEVQLAYIGDFFGQGCTVSNGQDGKASCTGVADPGEPVSVTITKDPDKIFADPSSGISAPTATGVDIVSIFKEENGERKELGSTTEFDVTGPGGMQSIELHTSCSQPLNLGDRFGSFAVVGLERKDAGFISLGGEVEYQFTVTNPNGVPVKDVAVLDTPFGMIASGETLDPNESKTFFITKTLYSTLTNEAVVTGNDATGAMNSCEADEDELTVDVLLPPQGSFDCSDAKPIDELSMTWNGGSPICVVAWDGSPGGTQLHVENLAPGNVVTVAGMGGSPNDQVWEIFEFGQCGVPADKLGESTFHISCSDSSMNGIEDCNSPQGNSKDDDPSLINTWLLEGMKGDQTLDCTPDPIPAGPGPKHCGLGFELAFLLPGFMWLRSRRRRSVIA